MNKASESILALKPVTFRYREEFDSESIPQFGLVAEEVERVNPDLVVRGADGKANGIRSDAINMMLLNEFLKEHRRMEAQEQRREINAQEQETRLAKQEATIAQQQKQIEALAAELRMIRDRGREQGADRELGSNLH